MALSNLWRPVLLHADLVKDFEDARSGLQTSCEAEVPEPGDQDGSEDDRARRDRKRKAEDASHSTAAPSVSNEERKHPRFRRSESRN